MRVSVRPLLARFLPIVIVLALLGLAAYAHGSLRAADRAEAEAIARQARLIELRQAADAILMFRQAVKTAEELGLSPEISTDELVQVLALLNEKKYPEATERAAAATTALQLQIEAAEAGEAEARKFGTVTFEIENGSGATLRAFQEGQERVATTADENGVIILRAATGAYDITVTKPGFQELKISGVIFAPASEERQSITLVPAPVSTPTPRPTPHPTAAPPAAESTAHSRYYRTLVSTSRGTFTADIMEFDLGAGKIKVITDTAANSDCTDDCPVLSVASYAARHPGAVGAIHGTYFCPPDYSTCGNETNAFFWKVKNPRLGIMINASNGLGENDGFLTFDAVGTPRYYNSWSGAGNVYAGINHKPTVVKNGSYSVNEGELDEKQRTSKIVRGALGVSDGKAYAVVVQGATIMDLGAVMDTLPVDYALNLDGGGSVGMWYNGAYKRGPGRAVPNAIVFVQQ